MRGFGEVEFFVGLAIVAALAGAGYWIHSEGVESGRGAERAAWLERDNKDMRTAQAALKAAQDRVRALEAEAQAKLAAADADHQRRLADEQEKHADFIAGVRAGRIVLRDPGAAARTETCGGRPAAADPAARDPDGAGGAQLSREASEFLWAEAERADLLAAKLIYAQKVMLAYYEACRGP